MSTAARLVVALASAWGLAACAAPGPGPVVASPDVEPMASAIGSRLEFPFLIGEIEGSSVSIGNTSHGRLVNGVGLVESDVLRILPRHKKRDLRYGTAPLIALLTHASRALGSATKTTLWVGNLGRKEGGDIEWSVSHNAGRDADVAFCYRDPVTGKPVDPPDLVSLGKNGLSSDRRYAFDAARTWLVVRAMIEFQGASLQYLFISDPLRKKLLAHARSIKEPALLIRRAAEIMYQPGETAPHNDHLHVRVYCSALDASAGCRDMGLTHSFARRFDAERRNGAERARAQLDDPRAAMRRRALLRLGLVGERSDARLAVAGLSDPSPDVRSAGAALLAALGTRRDTAILVRRFRDESDPAVLAALVDGIGWLRGRDAGPLLRDVLLASAGAPLALPAAPFRVDLVGGMTPASYFALPDESYAPLRLLAVPRPRPDVTLDRVDLRRLAVRAARHARRMEPVGPLIALLDSDDIGLAVEAARALASITRGRFLDGSEARELPDRLKAAKARYSRLLVGGSAPR